MITDQPNHSRSSEKRCYRIDGWNNTLYIERQKIKWFGHHVRMQQHQLPAQALYQRRSEVRARGRPRRRWIGDIKDIVETHGMTIICATHRALDHQLLLLTTLNGISGRW
jgi:hypothetical protein